MHEKENSRAKSECPEDVSGSIECDIFVVNLHQVINDINQGGTVRFENVTKHSSFFRLTGKIMVVRPGVLSPTSTIDENLVEEGLPPLHHWARAYTARQTQTTANTPPPGILHTGCECCTQESTSTRVLIADLVSHRQ